MKNTINLGIKMLVIIGLSVSMFAKEQKIDKLIEDDTLKKYERKAILFTKDFGLEQRVVSLPVTYCYPVTVKGKKLTKCRDEGTYEYKINETLENKMEKLAYDLIVGKRFDKVMVDKSKKIEMVLPTGIFFMKNVNVPPFNYNTGSLKDYTSYVNNFLEKMSKPVKDILSGTKTERYKQMSNTEKESFYVKKSKSSGLPVKFITKLMNSSFSFSVYIPEVSGSIKISKQETTVIRNGVKVIVVTYSTSLNTSLDTKLLVYRFNPDKGFVAYNTVNGKARGSSSKSFDNKPNKKQIAPLFEPSVLDATTSSSKKISYNLVKDDNFAIFAPVAGISGYKIKANIGVLEDLRVDAPYKIRKKVDGKTKVTGFAKTRVVFDNQYKGKDGKKVQALGSSSFDMIQGSVDIVSGMREHPWSGNFAFFGAASEKFNIDKLGRVTPLDGKGSFLGLMGGISSDLGFTLNKVALSEVWVDTKIFIGVGNEIEIINGATLEAPILISLYGAFSKRFYISSTGVYLAPKVELGYSRFSSKMSGTTDQLSVNSIDTSIGIDAGYNMGPNKELFLSLGYDISVYNSKAKLGDTDEELEVEVSRGSSIYLGYRQHIAVF